MKIFDKDCGCAKRREQLSAAAKAFKDRVADIRARGRVLKPGSMPTLPQNPIGSRIDADDSRILPGSAEPPAGAEGKKK